MLYLRDMAAQTQTHFPIAEIGLKYQLEPHLKGWSTNKYETALVIIDSGDGNCVLQFKHAGFHWVGSEYQFGRDQGYTRWNKIIRNKNLFLLLECRVMLHIRSYWGKQSVRCFCFELLYFTEQFRRPFLAEKFRRLWIVLGGREILSQSMCM